MVGFWNALTMSSKGIFSHDLEFIWKGETSIATLYYIILYYIILLQL